MSDANKSPAADPEKPDEGRLNVWMAMAAGAGVCALSGAITYIAGILIFYGGEWTHGSKLVAVLIGGSIVAAALAMDGRRRGALVLSAVWLAMGAAGIANVIAGEWVNLHNYGDVTVMGDVIESGVPYPRWLGSSALVTWGYWAVWRWPPLAEALEGIAIVAANPEALTLASADGYVKVAGAVVACLGAVLVLWRWRKPGVAMALLVPAQLMFLSGYDELYPFIGVAFVALAALALWGRWERWDVGRAGLLVGSIAVLYAGFVPLAVVALGMACISGRRWGEVDPGGAGIDAGTKKSVAGRVLPIVMRGLTVAAVAAIWVLIVIAICWPDGVTSFFQGIYGNLQPGNRNIAFARYKGQMASETGLTFRWDYAFSGEHLFDLAYMAFFGMGWAIPAIAAVALIEGLWRRRLHVLAAIRSPRVWAGVALGLLYLYYFIFFMPKLGPRRDVDLFFPVYMSIALLAGTLVERVEKGSANRALRPDRRGWTWRGYLTLCAVWGNAIVAAFFLLAVGLPSRGHDWWSPAW